MDYRTFRHVARIAPVQKKKSCLPRLHVQADKGGIAETGIAQC